MKVTETGNFLQIMVTNSHYLRRTIFDSDDKTGALYRLVLIQETDLSFRVDLYGDDLMSLRGRQNIEIDADEPRATIKGNAETVISTLSSIVILYPAFLSGVQPKVQNYINLIAHPSVRRPITIRPFAFGPGAAINVLKERQMDGLMIDLKLDDSDTDSGSDDELHIKKKQKQNSGVKMTND